MSKPLPLTPEQRLSLRIFPDIRRQAFGCLLKLKVRHRHADLRSALERLVERHDAFRIYFENDGDGVRQRHLDAAPDVHLEERDSLEGLFARPVIDPTVPPLFRAVSVETAEETYLYLAFHHLTFDGLSLKRLLGELQAILDDAPPAGRAPSFIEWIRDLSAPLDPRELVRLRAAWEDQAARLPTRFPCARRPGPNHLESLDRRSVLLPLDGARAAIRARRSVVRTDRLALTALLGAFRQELGQPAMHLSFTHNGRTEAQGNLVRTARMVGLLLTNYYAVVGAPDPAHDIASAYEQVNEQLDRLPAPSTFGRVIEQVGHESAPELKALSYPIATFSVQSAGTSALFTSPSFEEVRLPMGPPRKGLRTPDFSLSIAPAPSDGAISATCTFSPFQYDGATIEGWLARAARVVSAQAR